MSIIGISTVKQDAFNNSGEKYYVGSEYKAFYLEKHNVPGKMMV